MNAYEEAAITGCELAGATACKSLFRPASKWEPAGVGVTGVLAGIEFRHAIPILEIATGAEVAREFFEFVSKRRP